MLALVADASASHVGEALHQQHRPRSPWELLGFFSRKLDHTPVSYCTFDRELLAAFRAVWHFCFRLGTNHGPLTFALLHFC